MPLLNENQRLGVETTEGPLLILAGAGSGKTRVLTERIGYLIGERGVEPSSIMAITFTNKAAGEMRERVDRLVGTGARSVWIATFHSSCVRILRQFGDRLGYSPGFSIYDTDDQRSAMKEVLKRLNIDSKKFSERMFLKKISAAKDKLLTPGNISSNDPSEAQLARVYKAYSERLLSQNAMDFDDLIVKTVELFKKEPQVLEYYRNRLKYFMVDEYQDTNFAQFELVRLLCEGSGNICVVGDDDQSIYRFRGADILNILNFESRFPGCKVIYLEENYRSTSQILNAANNVIRNNLGRKEKRLWTGNADGDEVDFRSFDSAYEEAQAIADDIDKQVRLGKYNYNQCAILYRTNNQSRILEEKLLMENIPYRIVGGTNFYQRKEIKDTLAYLKVIANSRDDVSLMRIINVPKRGIGNTTIERVMAYAVSHSLSFYEALLAIRDIPDAAKAAGKIEPFTALIEEYRKTAMDTKVSVLLEDVLSNSGYLQMLDALDPDESQARLENIGELLSKAVSYENENPEGNLQGFLEEVSLIADIDNLTEEEERVLLMTLHSAKGLEFENVYLTGMEEGVFPGIQAITAMDDMEMEEERRLCYVGITRAKRRLTMTAARKRMVRGEVEAHAVSRFVSETGIEVADQRTSIPVEIPRYEAPRPKPYKAKFDPKTLGTKIEKKEIDYGPGDRVSHMKFGQGTVVSVENGPKDYEVTVDFDNAGQKRMMASFARLKKV